MASRASNELRALPRRFRVVHGLALFAAVVPLLTWSLKTSAIACVAPCVASGDKVVLATFWNAGRGDNMSVASAEGRTDAANGSYAYVRDEALVFRNYKPGLVPLRLYWSAARGDNFTEASMAGESDSGGYQFVRFEGWVYPTQQPGTIPLKLYWSASRGDNILTATAASEQEALAAGYTPGANSGGIEGYVFPAP